MIELFADQEKAIHDTREAMKSHRRVLFRGGCGSGKTVQSAYMSMLALQKNKTVIFGVHRRELARQTALTFQKFELPVSFIMAGYPHEPDCPIQIASADTIRTRPELIKSNLFFADEGHLWMSDNRQEILKTAYDRGSYIIPMTATPQRPDGRPLSDIADVMVSGATERVLIDTKRLARYRVIAPVRPDLSTLTKLGGDYTKKSIDALTSKPSVIKEAVKYYKEFAYGLRMIGYVHSRERGRLMAEEFTAAGIPAAFLDGDSSDDERKAAINKLADGEIFVIFNVNLWAEGFDASAQVGRHVPIQAVGLYSPTMSLPRAIQMMMRCMRAQDGVAIILDHASVTINHNGILNHGFPDDDRIWSLNAPVISPRKKSEAVISTVTCGHCFSVYRPSRPSCPYCYHDRDINGRHVKEIIAEMFAWEQEDARAAQAKEDESSKKAKKRMEVGMCKTVRELCDLALERNYNPGWVYKTAKAKRIPVRIEQVMKIMAELRA